MHRVAKLVRIIGLLGVAVALCACSAVKLVYDTLPQVSDWWLDGYIDLSDDQQPRVREDLARLHRWHRREELPKIAALLQRVEGMVQREPTPQEICAIVPDIRARLLALADRAEPAAVTLALDLAPQQLTHLERKYHRNNDDYRKEWIALSPEDLREKRFKQYLERMEMIYGRLDQPQRDLMRSQVEHTVFDAQTNLRERQRRQQDILRALRQLAGQPVPLSQARSTLHQLVERGLQSPDPAHRSYQDALIEEGCRNLAQLHQGTTPQQRQNAVRRLRAYQRDLQDLATEPG
jgi:hypothetical protein